MIKIRNLVKEFSGQKVLDGIDMDIDKGQVIA
ncbi:amino acid ABC transporter ATP-binding protein, partial [Streptococcus suis]